MPVPSDPGEAIEADLLRAVEQAWRDGNPIAGSAPTLAAAARRRWASQGRRLRSSASRVERIEDLAKGLRDRLEGDRHLVGPLMEDYRSLARRLADVLDPAT